LTFSFDVQIVPFIAAILAGIALVLGIWSLKRNMDIQAYKEMDSNYMEILKVGLERPNLRNPEKTTNYKTLTGEDRLRYETYAYLVWNLCETIYDRKMLDKTWMPVIVEEKRLHLSWLKDNPNKFKPEFKKHIEDEPIRERHGWFVR